MYREVAVKAKELNLGKTKGRWLDICKNCKSGCIKPWWIYVFPGEKEFLQERHPDWVFTKHDDEWGLECREGFFCGEDIPLICKLSPLQPFVKNGKVEKFVVTQGCEWTELSMDWLQEWTKLMNMILEVEVNK